MHFLVIQAVNSGYDLENYGFRKHYVNLESIIYICLHPTETTDKRLKGLYLIEFSHTGLFVTKDECERILTEIKKNNGQ